jgi:hypothetical protein
MTAVRLADMRGTRLESTEGSGSFGMGEG